MIWLSTNLSPEANPASSPVSGVMKPMLIVPVLPPPELPPEPEPLIPELHAASSPPAPTASDPAPTPLSKERREIGYPSEIGWADS